MEKLRIGDLVPTDDLPLHKRTQNFINRFIQCRDLAEAACLAGLMPEMGKKLYRIPRVQNAIQKRVNIVDGEIARLAARAKLLTVELLDSSLVQEVKNGKNGVVRVRAIELGYKRTGLIRDGEFYVAPDPNTNRNAPSIYKAQQTTLRQTVTTDVTHTEVQVLAANANDPIFAVREY